MAANFDDNRTMPRKIGSKSHPIHYFEPAKKSKGYVLYIPPSGALPLSQDAGRYEYFLQPTNLFKQAQTRGKLTSI